MTEAAIIRIGSSKYVVQVFDKFSNRTGQKLLLATIESTEPQEKEVKKYSESGQSTKSQFGNNNKKE